MCSVMGCSNTLPSPLLFWGSLADGLEVSLIGGQKWVPLLQVVCVLRWWVSNLSAVAQG